MKNNKISWINLAFISFVGVWGFSNIINGFYTYNGLHSIVPWLIVFFLYFMPYSLIVGELGSTFPSSGGGVSNWIERTINTKYAYIIGWIYWIVHMPYISQKPNTIAIATSFALFNENLTSNMNILTIQIISLFIFILAFILATKGITVLKKISSIAGIVSFIMMVMYIIMMFTAPLITKEVKMININFDSLKPIFNESFFLNFSILILAVGGCEKISPYVNQMKNPKNDFSKSMITLLLMVIITAVLGTIAMGMMVDSNDIPNDFIMNGPYYAFQKLGKYYNVGNVFLILYSICTIIMNLAVLIISIDAPLRILLDNVDCKYVPIWLMKKNNNEVYINGMKVVLVLVSILIILPAMGIENINSLVKWLIKLNSVCMPLRYLGVFTAYIALKVNKNNIQSGKYVFIKNKKLGIVVGIWCFLLTLVSCIMGMYSKNIFELFMNILTPIILLLLGLLMPILAKIESKHLNKRK